MTTDTDADIIYVPEDSYDGYAEVNSGLTLTKYNYHCIKVNPSEFDSVYNDIIITTDSNAPLMAVMYAKGFAANEEYMLKSEAEAVTNEQLNGLLNGNTSVQTFNEFKYFTGITIVGTSADAEESKTTSPFRQCTSLQEITLPPTVIELGGRAFDQCRNVMCINGIENVRVFDYACVQGTYSSAATQIIDTIHVSEFNGDYQFNNVFTGNCDIRNVIIDEGVTTIGNGAFFRVKTLETVSIPNTVTTIGVTGTSSSGAFCSCEKLKRVNSDVDGVINIPSGVTIIGHQAFYVGAYKYNTDITEINIPDSVTQIHNASFANYVNCTTLNIGSGITSFGSKALNDVGMSAETFTMTITATTPPTWDGYLNNLENKRILVPAESVDAYKAANGWSNYASVIEAII